MTTASGLTVTTVSTDQLAPLGFVLTVNDADNGLQEWVYVYNDDTNALRGADTGTPKYDVAQLDDDYALFHCIRGKTASAISYRIAGVAQHEIAAGSYGFVLRKGKGKVTTTAGAVVKGTALKTSSGGDVLDFGTDAASVIGMALAANSSAVANIDAYIDCNLG
tara:strand:- start:6571 stop:7062 length:492 start_codon:yes stop_codon:yes gene_type:complete